jgi:hypothetical protein
VPVRLALMFASASSIVDLAGKESIASTKPFIGYSLQGLRSTVI